MKVGYIGLGRMGSGMASNLIKAGAEPVVFDQLATQRAAFGRAGAQVADSVGDLTRRVDVIFTSLPGPMQVRDVVYGDDGVLDNVRADQALFELSTSSRSLARELCTDFAKRGAHVLDAPVSGGPAGAEAGTLAFWVGGDREVYDRFLPILQMMGDKPCYVGDIGAGTVVKLANNVTGYSIMLVLAETFSTAVKAGVDPLNLWEALRLGVVGKSSPLDLLRAQFLPGDYETPAFALELAYKDVALANELARELGVPTRMCRITMAEMLEALSKGLGAQDSRAYLKLQLERAGISIAVAPERLNAAFDRVDGATPPAPPP